MVYRKFLPVGQGAFYLEQFINNTNEKINVVYDCGSLTNLKIVKQQIEENFSEKEEILIVFISHLDADHVNGLEYLLENCSVKNIVFPLINSKDKFILSIDYLCSSCEHKMDDFTYKLINDPVGTINEVSKCSEVIYVDENNSYNKNIYRIYRENIIDGNKKEYSYVLSGENIFDFICNKDKLTINQFSNCKHWEYIPFNFRQDKRAKNLIKEIKNNLVNLKLFDPSTTSDEKFLQDLLKKWSNEQIQNTIRSAYEKISGSINTNSMVLFSGIKDENIKQVLIESNLTSCNFISQSNGCLYTGDYDASGKQKFQDLKKAYDGCWEYVGCIQIPHHGSYRSYNKDLALDTAYYIISAGKANLYRHPNGSVLKSLLYEGRCPFIVTEETQSKVVIKIN